MVILIWLYLNSVALLVGFELNVSIRAATCSINGNGTDNGQNGESLQTPSPGPGHNGESLPLTYIAPATASDQGQAGNNLAEPS